MLVTGVSSGKMVAMVIRNQPDHSPARSSATKLELPLHPQTTTTTVSRPANALITRNFDERMIWSRLIVTTQINHEQWDRSQGKAGTRHVRETFVAFFSDLGAAAAYSCRPRRQSAVSLNSLDLDRETSLCLLAWTISNLCRGKPRNCAIPTHSIASSLFLFTSYQDIPWILS